MAKLKTTREMIDEARGAGAEADALEVGMDAAKLSKPKPLTAEEQERLVRDAESHCGASCPKCLYVPRWAATVDYWRERAKSLDAERMLARMQPECESKCERAAGEIERLQARIAELRVDRDVLRGRSPFATPTVEALQARVAELEAELAVASRIFAQEASGEIEMLRLLRLEQDRANMWRDGWDAEKAEA